MLGPWTPDFLATCAKILHTDLRDLWKYVLFEVNSTECSYCAGGWCFTEDWVTRPLRLRNNTAKHHNKRQYPTNMSSTQVELPIGGRLWLWFFCVPGTDTDTIQLRTMQSHSDNHTSLDTHFQELYFDTNLKDNTTRVWKFIFSNLHIPTGKVACAPPFL